MGPVMRSEGRGEGSRSAVHSERGVLCTMNCCHLEREPGGNVRNVTKISVKMSDPKGEYDVVIWNRTGTWLCYCGQLVSLVLCAIVVHTCPLLPLLPSCKNK